LDCSAIEEEEEEDDDDEEEVLSFNRPKVFTASTNFS
jgi:hypothetical protein